MSKLLHHTGIWGLPTQEALGPMYTAYHQGPRVIAGCNNVGKSSTNEEVRVALHLPPLEDVIMRRRLGLLHRVIRTQSEWLLGLAVATRATNRGWAVQALKGLTALHEHEPGETPTLTHQLQGIFRDSPQRWKVRLKRLEQMKLLRHATEQDIRTLELYQQEAFATIGINVGKQEPITINECPKCHQTFTTPQGMRRHYVSMHSGMHVANLYAAGDTCPACLTKFWTRHKTITHLKSHRRCLLLARAYTEGYGRQGEVERGAQLRLQQHWDRVRVLGPLRYHYHRNGKVIVPPVPPPPPGFFTKEEVEACVATQYILGEVTYLTVEDLRHHPSRTNLKDITPYLGPIRVLLLLYGGRRRHGDVAHFAELGAAQMTAHSCQLVVCVVDLVHGSHHDISRGATEFWEPQIRGGRVAAIGAAPPCETWALARWIDNGWHDRAKPVPLRTAKELWGRKDLTGREARQVRTANVLLLYTLVYATMATMYGIAMWIEHPDLTDRHARHGTPDDPHAGAPSIWLIEHTQRLMVLPTTVIHRVKHCQFAGKAFKPTRIISIHMKQMQKCLDRQEKWVEPTMVLSGQDSTGQWKTAQAKEYPYRLSCALANGIIDAALTHSIMFQDKAQNSAQAQMHAFCPQRTEYEHEFGQDYVDNILPVHHLTAKWHSPEDMLDLAQVTFAKK